MVDFIPRTTCPSRTNKFYNSNINPYVLAGYGMFQNGGNCTAYAYGRFMEEANITSCKLSTGNAELWYPKTSDGYQRGKTPKVGAVICWEGKGKLAGHVAVVEKVYADGTILTSNSGWHSSLFWLQTIKPPYNIGYNYIFQGFIYNPYIKETPSPKPTDITGDIVYQSYDNVKKQWLPQVVNDRDYAGNLGNGLGGFRAKPKYGKIYMQSHIRNGNWLDVVDSTHYIKNSLEGDTYSGLFGMQIDGVKIWSSQGFVSYRVHILGGDWLPWVNKADNTPEGYAGIYGMTIDGIQMK